MPSCLTCGSSGAELVCGVCKTARYCSEQCQGEDWEVGHAGACQPPKTLIGAYGGGYNGSHPRAGIFVDGSAVLAVEPDLAVLDVGVETRAKTVRDARAEAARAMEAVVEAARGHGIVGRDIQTRWFSISPVYERRTVNDKFEITGYRVANTATLKIRELGAAGTIIDDVSAAGGDATRIRGILFTLEDSSQYMDRLREAAGKQALHKARHLAELGGVTLGRLVSIRETSRGAPERMPRAFAMSDAPAMGSTTLVSGGELELRLEVSASFSIA